MTGDAVLSSTVQTHLGEGLRWDERRDEMLGVDILEGRVYRIAVADSGALSLVREYWVPGTVGAIAPVEGDEGWLLAAGRGFVHLSPDGCLRPLPPVAPVGTRMNDAACDPRGRLWAGTLANDAHPGGGALYRLDVDGSVDVVLSDLTIANGLGWNPDATTMYLVDSGPRVVHAFAFDADTGTLSDDRVLVEVPKEVGTPDGLTVDAGGDIWVAVYGGARVQRYSPAGQLRETLPLPAHQVTSCAFAGPGLHLLYVTTATEGWTEEERAAAPDSGRVYHFDTDATGRPAQMFRPDPTWWATVVS